MLEYNRKILEVVSLSVSFKMETGYVSAVDKISFDINKNEILAVVGESGSGKSVCARSLMQLNSINSDSKTLGSAIFYDDFQKKDLLLLPPKEINDIRGNRISMIFQEPMTSLNPVLTIKDQITEVLIRHKNVSLKDAEHTAMDFLTKVKINNVKSVMKSYPNELSGGMRQRVMIAMALVCKPKLLIADEPTTALDVTIQAEILDLIKSLQQDMELSVLFITHDMSVVANIADRMIVMKNGKILESGNVENVLNKPLNDYTKLLLSSVPILGNANAKADNTKINANDTIIEINNLTTQFIARDSIFKPKKYINAVNDVSFEVFKGETLSIVGESGCGKSTLARTIVGLEDKKFGEITINNGKTIQESVRMIFQDPYSSLNPKLTVGFSVAEPLLIKGSKWNNTIYNRVSDFLDIVGLPKDSVDRYPYEFSGGQRQRICIARALIEKPDVIIADEALSALDVSIRASIIDLMLDLQKELRISWIFIAHDLAVVEKISNRVIVMYMGRIVEKGSVKDVFENPSHPYTKSLLSSVPTLKRGSLKNRIIYSSSITNVSNSKYIDNSSQLKQITDTHFVLHD